MDIKRIGRHRARAWVAKAVFEEVGGPSIATICQSPIIDVDSLCLKIQGRRLTQYLDYHSRISII